MLPCNQQALDVLLILLISCKILHFGCSLVYVNGSQFQKKAALSYETRLVWQEINPRRMQCLISCSLNSTCKFVNTNQISRNQYVCSLLSYKDPNSEVFDIGENSETYVKLPEVYHLGKL